MTDEIYYSVINHYFHQCGYVTDLWLSYTMAIKWDWLNQYQKGDL